MPARGRRGGGRGPSEPGRGLGLSSGQRPTHTMTVTEAAGDEAAYFRRAQSGVNRAQVGREPRASRRESRFQLVRTNTEHGSPVRRRFSLSHAAAASLGESTIGTAQEAQTQSPLSLRLGQAGPLPPSLIRHSSLTPRQHPPATLQPSAPAHRDPLGVWLGSAPRLPTLRHYPGRGSTAPKAAALSMSRRGPSLWAGAWRATRSGS